MTAVQVETPAKVTIGDQSLKILQHFRGVHATRMMDLGVKLGLFEALANAPNGITARELADKCKTNAWYTQVWCQAALALELLSSTGQTAHSTRDTGTRYTLPPFFDELLVKNDGIFYLGEAPNLNIQLSRDHKKFPKLFKTGKTFPFQEHDKEFLVSVAKATRLLAKVFMIQVLPKIPGLSERLRQGGKILDIGCGAGFAMVELAKSFPRCTCLGVDIEPNSIRLAKQLIRKNGLQDRVKADLVKGDEPEEFGPENSFDLVTLFAVLHEVSANLKGKLLGSVARALAPGGTLLILDPAYPEKLSDLRSEPQRSAVMTQWFEATWGNIVNTATELKEMVSKAGLKVTDEIVFSRHYILTATKNSS